MEHDRTKCKDAGLFDGAIAPSHGALLQHSKSVTMLQKRDSRVMQGWAVVGRVLSFVKLALLYLNRDLKCLCMSKCNAQFSSLMESFPVNLGPVLQSVSVISFSVCCWTLY